MGARIRARRVMMELSQEELGKRAGIGKGMVSAIERGTDMPSVRVLGALGRALESGVDVLLYGSGRGSPRHQAALPGMSLDERVAALPDAMREFVLLSIARAERAKGHVPAQFLKPPTSDNWPQFAAYLEAITLVRQKEE